MVYYFKTQMLFLEHKLGFVFLGSKILLQIQNGHFSIIPIIPFIPSFPSKKSREKGE
jgi:hypothetical protein